MEIEDALRVAEAVNRQGISVTLDSLGESVTSEAEAHKAAEMYYRLLDAIAKRKLDANVSVKLTQMGLELSLDGGGHGEPALRPLLGNFVHRHGNSSLTQVTLDIVRRPHALSGRATPWAS